MTWTTFITSAIGGMFIGAIMGFCEEKWPKAFIAGIMICIVWIAVVFITSPQSEIESSFDGTRFLGGILGTILGIQSGKIMARIYDGRSER